MFQLLACFLLLAQPVDVRFSRQQVTPGKDSYTIIAPQLAELEVDLQFRVNNGPPQEYRRFCRLDKKGRAVIRVPSGIPAGVVDVIGIRPTGLAEWMPTQARIRVLPEPPLTARQGLRTALWQDLKLFGAALLALLAIFSAGRWLLSRLGQPFDDRTEAAVFAWGLGCLAIGSASFLLALCGLAYRGLFVGLAFLALLGWRSSGLPPQTRSPSLLERAGLLLGAFYGAIYFVAALAPEVSPDGVAYHLGLVHLYQAHHRMVFYPETFYAALPQGMEMVYLFCSSLGGYSVARLAHLACLVALTFAMQAFARRIGCPRGGAVAAAAVFTSSLVGSTATTAYVDVALTLAVFLSFYAAFLWRQRGARPFLWIAGLSSGLAMSIKPTGMVALLIVLAMALWPTQDPAGTLRRRLRAAGLAALLALVIVAPWLARNWVVFQNPLMPVANRWFPNPHLLPTSEAVFLDRVRHAGGFGRNPRDYLGWPLEVTVGGARLQGFFGPFFLLAPLALLAAKTSEGRWLLAAAALAASPLAGNLLTRFMMPAVPFLALTIVMGIQALLPARAAGTALALALAVQGVADLPWIVAQERAPFMKEVPFRAAFRLESERDYLARSLENFPVIEFLNRATPRDARILTFGRVFHQAYTTRFLMMPYASEFAQTLVDTLFAAANADQTPSTVIQGSFRPVRARAVRLEQPRTAPYSYWAIYELDFIGGDGRPVSREGWNFSANVNPFDAANVADGNPLAGWSTRAPVRAGTRFQVDLGTTREIRGIRYTLPPGQVWLLPEVLASTNGTIFIPVRTEFRTASLPPRNWRAEATALLKSRGADYLVFVQAPHEWAYSLACDFLENREQWGLREAFRSGEAVVMEIRPRFEKGATTAPAPTDLTLTER